MAPQCRTPGYPHRAVPGAIRTGLPISARDLEIFRRALASIRDFLVLDDLTLIQTGQTGLLDGRDVNKDVFPAALRLNEPVSFLRIEPLHSAARHSCSLQSCGGFHSLQLVGN